MKIIIPLFFLLAVHSQGFPQDRDEAPARRSVSDNILSSHELPRIKIKVADEFDFVGSFPFQIIAATDEYPEDTRGKPIAAGERFVFAASDINQTVEKLLIVQFEGFLPNNEFTYNYDFSKANPIGENKYRHNLWFYDGEELAEKNPENEGARTRRFLRDKGFSLEDEVMMSRFVGLASQDRKNEIIIYYLEMLKRSTGYSLEVYENSVSPEETKTIEREFFERSQQSFKVIDG